MPSPIFRIAGLSLVVAGLAACSSTPIEPTAASTAAPLLASQAAAPTAAQPAAASANPAAQSTVASVALPAYLDPANPLSRQRSVFFDFDDFAIDRDDALLIERHGRFLAQNPALVIRIEGSSDERGSAEYNLALGQKRAQAVLRALQLYGVKDGQMEAVSWGEEKPLASGHDESAWSQNRRADLQYPSR